MSDTTEKILIACPNCQKQYRVPLPMVGKQAACKCGSTFQVRIPTEPEPEEDATETPAATAPPPSPQVSATDCRNHPGVSAMFACADCRKLICRPCSYTQLDGRHLCSDCAIRSASPSLGGSSMVLAGTCLVHRNAQATARCQYCGTLSCPTCDFHFPGDLHLCPRCATSPTQGFSRVRKSLLVYSLVMAAVALVAMVALFLVLGRGQGMDPIVHKIVSLVLGNVLVAVALVGFGLACGSFDRRAGNPAIVWVTLVLNSLICVLGLGLAIVVSLRG